MILVNGIPNSGAHAVMSLLASFGMERIPGMLFGMDPHHPPQIGATVADPDIEGLCYSAMKTDRYFLQGRVLFQHASLIDAKVIWVLRHPRNVIVSGVRQLNQSEPKVSLEEVIRLHNRIGIVGTYRAFMGWRETAMVIRYEDIPPEFTEPHPALYQDSAKNLDTFTGNPSDWTSVWTEQADKCWAGMGGPELEAELGYAI